MKGVCWFWRGLCERLSHTNSLVFCDVYGPGLVVKCGKSLMFQHHPLCRKK